MYKNSELLAGWAKTVFFRGLTLKKVVPQERGVMPQRLSSGMCA